MAIMADDEPMEEAAAASEWEPIVVAAAAASATGAMAMSMGIDMVVWSITGHLGDSPSVLHVRANRGGYTGGRLGEDNGGRADTLRKLSVLLDQRIPGRYIRVGGQ